MADPAGVGFSRGPRRRRTSEQARQDRQKKWEETMKKRTTKNERHVDVASIGANHWAIRAIEAQGLSYLFGENPGYYKALVTEFYKHMKILELGAQHEPNVVITSKIERIEVLVNRYEIATDLDYQHPATHEINYPRENFATAYDMAQELYINPTDA